MRRAARIIVFIGSTLGLGVFFLVHAQYGGMPGYPPGSGGGTYTPPPAGSGGGGSGSTMTAQTVSVSKIGSGSGVVSGGPVNCGQTCQVQVMGGAPLTLTASADSGSVFSGWGGDCAVAGSGISCDVATDASRSVTAMFDPAPSSSGADSGSGDRSSGGDQQYGDDWATYATDFQENFTKPAASKVRKPNLGISVFGQIRNVLFRPFSGSLIGSNWRVTSTPEGDMTAQGMRIGPGSRIGIKVSMTTGAVSAQFDGKGGCWMVSYYNDQGAERKELYRCAGDSYQEESVSDIDGASERSRLVLHGTTLFADLPGGTLFAVDSGTLPDASPAGWADSPIPHAKNPLIPVQRILDLLPKQAASLIRGIFAETAHAAAKAATAIQAYQRIGAYRQAIAALASFQQAFAGVNFDDPNTDFAAMQDLIAAYQEADRKAAGIRSQMGRLAAFVRDGNWAYEGGQGASDLMSLGIGAGPAALLMQMQGQFDFYAIGAADAKAPVIAGSCAMSQDADGVPQIACGARAATKAETQAVRAAEGPYASSADAAHGALEAIEKALFAGEGA